MACVWEAINNLCKDYSPLNSIYKSLKLWCSELEIRSNIKYECTANFLMLVEQNCGWVACFICINVYSSFILKIDIFKQYI